MAKGKKTGGRVAGTPNKLSGSVKASLQAVYELRGGDQALLSWAQENQTEFYKLWGRMLPQEVSGPNGGDIPVRASLSVGFIGVREPGGRTPS